MEERIRALSAQGLTGRQIARQLGINRGRVQRLLAASPPPARSGSTVVALDADPITSLLTAAEWGRLGVSGDGGGRVLNALERHRLMGLPVGSAAGDAVRLLFDHGRNTAAFNEWVFLGAGEPVPVPGEPMPGHIRDERIVALRAEGWTLADIGAAVNMSEGGVSRALQRLTGDLGTSDDW